MQNFKPEVKIDKDKKKIFIKTSMFRVSYPNVFEAKAIQEGQAPKYSMVMLFPKKHDLKWLKDAVELARKFQFGDKVPKGFKNPLKDGDSEDYADQPGYKGMMVVSCSTNAKRKPQIINNKKELITDESEFYPGCWARATLTCAGYDAGGGKGVTFYLSNVQKIKDDESFSTRRNAEDDFEEFESEDEGSEDSSNYEDMDV